MKLGRVALLSLVISSFLFLNLSSAWANSAVPVHATIRISVCGNGVVEKGEECDSISFGGASCSSLGFSGGLLSCTMSCGFQTTGCIVPTVNPDNVSPDDILSLVAAGYFVVPQTENITSASSIAVSRSLTVAISDNGGTSRIVMPQGVVISRVDGANLDPTALTASAVAASSVSGVTSGATIDGALQWGLSGVSLEFSAPITLNIFVGSSLDGQTPNVVRSTNLATGWTTDGIVSPATCVVSSGQCSFQATKASYFVTTRLASTSNTTSSETTSSSTSPTATLTPSVARAPLLLPKKPLFASMRSPFNFPAPIRYFDIDQNGRIDSKELFEAVQLWVRDWKLFLNKVPLAGSCDINKDGVCGARDLSILLFYVNQ